MGNASNVPTGGVTSLKLDYKGDSGSGPGVAHKATLDAVTVEGRHLDRVDGKRVLRQFLACDCGVLLLVL